MFSMMSTVYLPGARPPNPKVPVPSVLRIFLAVYFQLHVVERDLLALSSASKHLAEVAAEVAELKVDRVVWPPWRVSVATGRSTVSPRGMDAPSIRS